MKLEIYIEPLSQGKTVQFRPIGQSMTPRINSGEQVTVSPDVSNIQVGDVVLCKVKGRMFLHLISAMNGDRVQISNNHGHVNGWTNKSKVYGKVIRVDP